MVHLWCYNQNSSKNANAVEIGNLVLYFSYETIVAFRFKGELFISENVWGATTGKHLYWIDSDKKKRLPHDAFEEKLKYVLGECGLAD